MMNQQKQPDENEKNEGRISKFCTHCLTHHSPGAPNTAYLAYPVVSQEAMRCNNTPVAHQMGNHDYF
jgi:hypothetical protein